MARESSISRLCFLQHLDLLLVVLLAVHAEQSVHQ
jgi:hypothetical protein